MTSEAARTVARIEAGGEKAVTEDGGCRVVWRCFGEGPPVVLLHGDFGSWTHWIRNIGPLSRQFRLLVADMPGYGDSGTPAEPHLPETLAVPLAAGIGKLMSPGQRIDLVGFSYGGMVAGHVAARLGQRVRRLVLSGPGGFGTVGEPPGTPDLRRIRADMSEAEIDAVHRHNLAALMIADPDRIDDLAVHIQRENIRRARVRCGRIPLTTDLLEILPSVTARLSAICGERDAFAAPGERLRREALLRQFDPDIDFRVLPGAGHWLFFEAPETANGWLKEILQTAP